MSALLCTERYATTNKMMKHKMKKIVQFSYALFLAYDLLITASIYHSWVMVSHTKRKKLPVSHMLPVNASKH